jgi:hypothetical protein
MGEGERVSSRADCPHRERISDYYFIFHLPATLAESSQSTSQETLKGYSHQLSKV